jgi:hypothetical protein
MGLNLIPVERREKSLKATYPAIASEAQREESLSSGEIA